MGVIGSMVLLIGVQKFLSFQRAAIELHNLPTQLRESRRF